MALNKELIVKNSVPEDFILSGFGRLYQYSPNIRNVYNRYIDLPELGFFLEIFSFKNLDITFIQYRNKEIR